MKYMTYEERRRTNATFWHPVETYYVMKDRKIVGKVRWLFQLFERHDGRRNLTISPSLKITLPFERLRKQDYAGIYFGLTILWFHVNVGVYVQHGRPDY